MNLFKYFLLVVLFAFTALIQADTLSDKHSFYRNLWSPAYNNQRLNYCSLDGKKCGLAVANDYCKMMGYEKASEAIIDYHVGETNYFLSNARCKGWHCNGFMLITCVGRFSHKPTQDYSYRSKRFVFPRFDNYRIDWCYKNGRGCGQRTANSFCRRMGYMSAQFFKKEEHVSATKAIGNQRLCFGDRCSGFSSITCYR